MKLQNLIHILIGIVCITLSPRAQAVSPPPDGGYPGGNTAEGENALLSLTTGTYNTAVGLWSLGSNTEGKLNTAIGAGTLLFNTADANTAIGAGALFSNTTGRNNTAIGEEALASNTIANDNTAIGLGALFSNTTGSFNTANGFFALTNNTEGGSNTANGANALAFNTTGSDNTATGNGALFNNNASGNTANGANALLANTTGFDNTAMGETTLRTNISGRFNTAIGSGALALSTGDSNTAVGSSALGLSTGDFNTAVGDGALVHNTGSHNTALGWRAGSNLTTGDENIDIGFDVIGVPGESNTIRIGTSIITATFIRGISGATAVGGAAVFVTSNGHLGTMTSSARFKDEIKPMGNASEAILALRPVSFRYKKEIDPQGIPEFGLVAEEVEKVNPDLVIRDPEGRPYTVRYEQVNAMLLNEFLKEHRTVQEQKAIVEQLKQDFQSKLAEQQKQIEALSAGLEKVSAQLEANKSAPQVVMNNP
jgi:hypothetical protein